MAPLRSFDAAVNSNSRRGRQLGPTKSYGKDPASHNPLYDTPARPRRLSAKENASGDLFGNKLPQPDAPRKRLALFPNPRAVLYSPIKLQPQSSDLTELQRGGIHPGDHRALDPFHSFLAGPSLDVTPSRPGSGSGTPANTQAEVLCLDAAASEGYRDDVIPDRSPPVAGGSDDASDVQHALSSPITVSDNFHDGASDDLGAYYEGGFSQADAEALANLAESGYPMVGSPASVNTEQVSPGVPDRWREEAYLALRSTTTTVSAPELPSNHGPPALISMSEAEALLLHHDLPEIGNHNRAAMTTLTVASSAIGGGDGSQGSGSLSQLPSEAETVAIPHCFSPGPAGVGIDQYEAASHGVATSGSTSAVASRATSNVAVAGDPQGPGSLPWFVSACLDTATVPQRALPDGSLAPFNIFDIFTYTRESLDGHFFRSRARISKFDPEEPRPGNLTLLHTLCSSTAFGITIPRFRQIFTRCSQCHAFAYADNQTKHVCRGRSVRRSATAKQVYDCLIADPSGGITMRQMQSVFAMCGACERILADEFGEFHACNPDVSQDSC
ncbi:hypothetical protein MD484_g8923, partial [Candolleomyces efflorescens]